MAIFGGIAAEVIRQERERRLADCIARKRREGMSEEEAMRSCMEETG